MLLEKILSSDSYIYAERYVNTFKKTANEVSEKYCAIGGIKEYYLPEMSLKKCDAEIFLANPNTKIFNEIFSKKTEDEITFYIHPDMIKDLPNEIIREIKYNILVKPTSSTRTVLPNNKEYFIKLHLDKRLSKYIRRLSQSSIQHSINVSNIINSCIESNIHTCPKTFGFLPESIGIFNKKLNYGMIIREKIPRPIIDSIQTNTSLNTDQENKRYYFPLFSLYSKDLKHPEDKTLFTQIVNKNNINPKELFLEQYLKPLFIGMNYFINNQGILLEPHGQNVLIEIDTNFNITRLIHRDFQSIYIDNNIRKINNLEMIFQKHIMGTECTSKESYSLVYDHFIGRYVFDEFLELLETEHNIPKNQMIQLIKNEFKKHFDKTLFPKEAYFMDKKTFENNKTILIQDVAKYR